jgi:hypothetical protein
MHELNYVQVFLWRGVSIGYDSLRNSFLKIKLKKSYMAESGPIKDFNGRFITEFQI